MAEMTPMMKQYLEMKERNPDSILFFRLGDFYEMFNEDARLVSKELDLTLTTRDRNKPPEERTPMCGVPYHSCDSYIARLIAKGYKVAICEQTEDPATAKGLVDRDIIRVITPGTVIASSMLEEGRNNFLCAVYADSTALGLCLCDISTGEVFATSFPSGEEALPHLENELGRFHPAEAVLSDGAWNLEGLTGFLREKLGCLCENGGEGRFRYDVSRTQVEGQFRAGLDSLPEGDRAAVQATGGLLSYLYETQKTDLSHIAVFTYYTAGQFMELDLTARQTLELTETMRGKEKKGSLLWVLDKTRTAMGHRLIRGWLERPLLSPVQIARRQQAVIVLTTAGDDPDRRSIGWEIHEKCRRLLAWRRGEPERELDSDLPEWCPIMFGIGVITGDDPDKIDAMDIYDEALWFACNPGLGHNLRLSNFRREARAARQSEAAERLFRWLRLNQWISVKSVGWVPVTIYDKTQFNRPEWAGMNVLARRRAVREYLRGKRCFGGLDLSKSTDLTAFALIFPPQEGLETWVALFWGWVPLDDLEARETRDGVPYGDWIRADFLQGCEGDIIDYDAVEQTIWQAAEEFDLACLGLDPAMSWTLSQRLMQSTAEHEAIQVVEIRQNMTGMSPATKQLELLLRKGMMLHEHNTAARWCFGNVRCATDGNENMKPMKNRSVGRIDIAVAWIIAMAAAMLCDTEKPDLAAALGRADFTL